MLTFWLTCALWLLVLDGAAFAQVTMRLCVWPQLETKQVSCSSDGSSLMYIQSIVMTRLLGGLTDCTTASKSDAAEFADCRVTLSQRDSYYQQLTKQCSDKPSCTLNGGPGAAASYIGQTSCGLPPQNATVRNLAVVTLQCIAAPTTTREPTTALNAVRLTSTSAPVTVRSQPLSAARTSTSPDVGSGGAALATFTSPEDAIGSVTTPADDGKTKVAIGASVGGVVALLIGVVVVLMLARNGYLYRCTKYAGRSRMVEDGCRDPLEESAAGRAVDQLRRMIAEEQSRQVGTDRRRKRRTTASSTASRHHRPHRSRRAVESEEDSSRHRSRHRSGRRMSRSAPSARRHHDAGRSEGRRRARAESTRTASCRSSGAVELMSEVEVPATDEWVDEVTPEVETTTVVENEHGYDEELAGSVNANAGRRDTRQRPRRRRRNDKTAKSSRTSKHSSKKTHVVPATTNEQDVDTDTATADGMACSSSSHKQSSRHQSQRTCRSSKPSSSRAPDNNAELGETIYTPVTCDGSALQGLPAAVNGFAQPGGSAVTHKSLTHSISNSIVAAKYAQAAQGASAEEGALTQDLQVTSVSRQAKDNASRKKRSRETKERVSSSHKSKDVLGAERSIDLMQGRGNRSAQQTGEYVAPVANRKHNDKAEPTARALRHRRSSLSELAPDTSLGNDDEAAAGRKFGRGSKRHSRGPGQSLTNKRVSQKRTSRRKHYEIRRNEMFGCSSASDSEPRVGETRMAVVALVQQATYAKAASLDVSRRKSAEHRKRSSEKAASTDTRSSRQAKDKKPHKTSRTSVKLNGLNGSRDVTIAALQPMGDTQQHLVGENTLVETVISSQVFEVFGDDAVDTAAKMPQINGSETSIEAAIPPTCIEISARSQTLNGRQLLPLTYSLYDLLTVLPDNKISDNFGASTHPVHTDTGLGADGVCHYSINPDEDVRYESLSRSGNSSSPSGEYACLESIRIDNALQGK